jgi:hypothetical protein
METDDVPKVTETMHVRVGEGSDRNRTLTLFNRQGVHPGDMHTTAFWLEAEANKKRISKQGPRAVIPNCAQIGGRREMMTKVVTMSRGK